MIKKRQAGSSLIEVLIAVLVLSVGLLGMATLQFDGIKRNTDSYLRTQAINLAYDMSDRIRVNRSGALEEDDRYVVAMGATPAGTTKAAQDLQAWFANLANTLPSGAGSISSTGDEFTITVCWDESRDGLAVPPDPCFSFVSGL
jgi:type IV pilus assembly protein PilV